MNLFGAVWLADLRFYGLEQGKPIERPVLRKPFSRRKNSELVEFAVYGKTQPGLFWFYFKKGGGSLNERSSEFE